MIGNRYELKDNKKELLEIEKDLAKYLGVPFVKCSDDAGNSHLYQDEHEVNYRRKEAGISKLWACVITSLTMRNTKRKKNITKTMVVMMEKYMNCFI